MMPIQLKKSGYRHRFDFEVGYLTKSPCRDCSLQGRLPDCSENCRLIHQIQVALSETVSCVKPG